MNDTRHAREAFHESAQLLMRLHELTKSGQQESKEADQIRDKMESPWAAMSDEERKRIRGLSADLYSIGENHAARGQAELELEQSIEAACREKRWGDLLEQVRHNAQRIPPAYVALFRGISWFNFGQPQVAIEFLREAKKLAPHDSQIEAWILFTLFRTEHIGEAVAQAETLAQSSSSPFLLLLSARLLFMAAPFLSRATPEYLKLAEQAAERGLSLSTDSDLQLREARSAVFFLMALRRLEAGRREEALDLCKFAVAANPDNSHATQLVQSLDQDHYAEEDRQRFLNNARLGTLTLEMPFEHQSFFSGI